MSGVWFIARRSILIPVLVLSACSASSIPRPDPQAVENLQAAYNGKSNAHIRYLAYARRAEAEDYGEVASLFRAAARAEEVHASGLAALILQTAAIPLAHIAVPQAGTTRDNLIAAIEESSRMQVPANPALGRLPPQVKKSATATLNIMSAAETQNAKLYTASLRKLDQLKGSDHATFYVCSSCGYVTRDPALASCPACSASKMNFEKVTWR